MKAYNNIYEFCNDDEVYDLLKTKYFKDYYDPIAAIRDGSKDGIIDLLFSFGSRNFGKSWDVLILMTAFYIVSGKP